MPQRKWRPHVLYKLARSSRHYARGIGSETDILGSNGTSTVSILRLCESPGKSTLGEENKEPKTLAPPVHPPPLLPAKEREGYYNHGEANGTTAEYIMEDQHSRGLQPRAQGRDQQIASSKTLPGAHTSPSGEKEFFTRWR